MDNGARDADLGPLFAAPEPEPHARRTDPPTSQIAAASMSDAARGQRRDLRRYLAEQGEQGATANECDRHFGWRDATAGRRLSEMHRALGWAIPARDAQGKLRTRDTESGRLATVYCLTAHGWDLHLHDT